MALKVLLDTNRLTDALRGDANVVEILDEALEVSIPFITVSEFKAGFLGGARTGANENLLAAFLRLPGVGILFPDRETTEVYARLFVYLWRAGTPVSANDLWIASLAVQHHLTLLTRDEHFQKLPQVSRA